MKWFKALGWTLAMAPFAWGGIKLIRALPEDLFGWQLFAGLFCLTISNTLWDKAWNAMGFGE